MPGHAEQHRDAAHDAALLPLELRLRHPGRRARRDVVRRSRRCASCKIGVQLIGDDGANTPPAHALARRGIVENVRGYHGLRRLRASRTRRPASSRRWRRARSTSRSSGDRSPATSRRARRCRCGSRRCSRRSTGRACRWPSTSRWACAAGTRRCGRSSMRSLARRRPEIDAILAAYGVPRVDPPTRRREPCNEARSPLLARDGVGARRPASARSASFALTVADRERGEGRARAAVRRARPARRARSAARARSIEGNAYHLSQGKTLYTLVQLRGCHANGGGGSGPALMDDDWIYGSSIENIVHDHPRGPAERHAVVPRQDPGRPDLADRRLCALDERQSCRRTRRPSRDDHMHPRPAENRTPTVPPVTGGSTPPLGSGAAVRRR